MIKGISRRSFTAMGGAAALGAAALPAVASAHAAGLDYATQTNGMPSFMVPPEPVAQSDIVSVLDYDVVIVGAGTTGFAAAVAAHNAGVKACVVQKQAIAVAQGKGGSGVDLANSDPAALAYLVDIHVAANHYRPIRSVVQNWVDWSGEAWNAVIDYTADLANPLAIRQTRERQYGDTALKASTFKAGPTDSDFAGAVPQYFDKLAEDGFDVYYETPAVQLVQASDGAITGVVCESGEGYKQFNASMGVILCAGDYQNDDEMVDYLLPDMANCVRKQSGKTGDGIKMGVWAGGVIEPVGHSKMSHGYGNGPMAGEPLLIVDSNGERFCCEGIDLSLMQNYLRFHNPSGLWFQIFDSNYEEYVNGWGGSAPEVDSLDSVNPESESYSGKGRVYRADTLEELAAKLDIPADAFIATVERYNELCAEGADTDFGKFPQYMKPVDTAPFYGIARNTGITAILSGLLTDGCQRVVDADGAPIKGLYAAGNNAGGFFGAIDYPFTGEYIDAISIGRCISGGYSAVMSAIDDAR